MSGDPQIFLLFYLPAVLALGALARLVIIKQWKFLRIALAFSLAYAVVCLGLLNALPLLGMVMLLVAPLALFAVMLVLLGFELLTQRKKP